MLATFLGVGKTRVEALSDISQQECMGDLSRRFDKEKHIWFAFSLKKMLPTLEASAYRNALMQVGYQHHMGEDGMPTVTEFLLDDVVYFDLRKVNQALMNSLVSECRVYHEAFGNLMEFSRLVTLGLNYRQAYAICSLPVMGMSRNTQHFTVSTAAHLSNLYAVGIPFILSDDRGWSGASGAMDLFKRRSLNRYKYKDISLSFVIYGVGDEEQLKNIIINKLIEVLK